VAEYILEALWSPATAIKVFLILVSWPLWSPVLKMMWRETKEAFEVRDVRSDGTEQVVNRPAGQDPWLNIPRGTRRGGGFPAARPAPPTARGGSGPRTPSRPARRTGF